MTPTAEKRTVNIVVVDGVEGPSIYLDQYRIAGNKPWGGGDVLYEWTADWDDIQRALKLPPTAKSET